MYVTGNGKVDYYTFPDLVLNQLIKFRIFKSYHENADGHHPRRTVSSNTLDFYGLSKYILLFHSVDSGIVIFIYLLTLLILIRILLITVVKMKYVYIFFHCSLFYIFAFLIQLLPN